MTREVQQLSYSDSRTTNPNTIYDPFQTIRKFKNKNSLIDSRNKNKQKQTTPNNKVTQFISSINQSFNTCSETITQTRTDNLTREERLAIRTLANNDNIIINKADKGSTIVVLDKEDYIRDGLKHLNDPSVYRKLTTDTTPRVKQ